MAKKKRARPQPRKKTSTRRLAEPRSPPPAAAAPARKLVPIVGIGASAGGLDAFKKFFSAMPPASDLAFVLIPHLDPTHESLMVELLGKYTSMAVVEAGEGMAVEANHVYIIPPNKYLTISAGVLRLTGPVERGRSQTSIDFFLRSLADDQQERAICIILSGTGGHGTLGLKAVKAAGGMAMVQDPPTAEYPRMPESAVASGLADYVLAPEKMPAALVKYVQHFYVNGGQADIEESPDRLQRILALLRARTKHDFRCYRKKMLLRRVERRMGLNHIEELADYLEHLRHHPEEVKQLAKDLLISVTSFFRDPESFQALETHVIGPLVEAMAAEQPLRIWVPGCATGEEAYSIGMVCMERLGQAQKNCRLQIFASDVDEEAMKLARQGIYPDSIIGDVSPDRLARFFSRHDEQTYQVNKQLREAVVFAVQNVLADAPFSKLDLISCRNLLIYLEPEIQQKIVTLTHFALNEGGYLLLGPSETIGRQIDLFETVSKKWRIYRRIGVSRPGQVDFPILPRGGARLPGQPAAEPGPGPQLDVAELARHLLLNQYAPAAVLINRANEILYFFGPTMRYLDQPTGGPTQDLMLLAREGLRTKLRAAIHKAMRDQEKVSAADIRIKRNGTYHAVRVTIQPVQRSRAAEGLLLITFEEEPEVRTVPPAGPEAEQEQSLVRQLEYELKTTGEDLQSTIEELESSNEELKAANEEVMSMNEELQSANEELETSKEELQSLNEELTTVNNQLQDKIEELQAATNDMANLLDCTDVATVFLDSEFRIKRFTPASSRFLNLIAGDVGRPIRDITPKFADLTLLHDAERVLRHLAPLEKELQTEDGHWCLRRILPYRTVDNRIEGVILTLVDITNIKRAQDELRRMSKVFMDGADPIIIEDLEGCIVDLNLETTRVYGWSRAEMLGQPSNLLGVPEEQAGMEDRRAQCQAGQPVRNIQAVHRTKAGQVFPVLLTLSLLRDESGEPSGIIAILKPIIELKRTEAEQALAKEMLEKRVAERTAELQTMNQKLEAEIVERAATEEALRESQVRIAADLTQLRDLEREVMEIAEREQRRIGQDLHDEVGQELTGLSLQVENLIEFFKNPATAEAKTATKIAEGLKRCLRTVRELSTGLIPVEVDPEGLMAAVKDLAERTNEHHKINCVFQCDEPVLVEDYVVAGHLFRIAQEAITNAVKHSRARHIKVSLASADHVLTLRVVDDGVGVPAQPVENSGMGLKILRYRAGLINARLTIEPGETGGTAVTCAVPQNANRGHDST